MKLINLLFYFLVIAASYSFAQFTNVAVTTNTYDQSEPTIAVSSLNPNNVLAAWNDFRSEGFSKAGYAFSTNNGSTWTEGFLPPPPDNQLYKYGFDPSVSYDQYGNSFYCYIATPSLTLGAVYIAKTTNNGSDWSHKQVSSLDLSQDKPFMAVDNTGGSKDGRIYVSWTDFSSGTAIKFSYSSNHGSSFSTPITLSSLTPNPGIYAQLMPTTSTSGNPTTAFVQGSMPAVGPNGELYVVWANVTTNGAYNGGTFKIGKSTDGGLTFGTTNNISQFTPRRNLIGRLDNRTYLPSMAVDPLTGNIYVVYPDQASQTNTNLRIKFVRSTDDGNTWSSPMIIADFGTGWQLMPWISVDENGRVSVLLIHSSDLTLVDSYITESHDNGVSFLSPLRISTQSSNPANSSWTHHYNGVANIGDGDSYSIWTDYRNGNADIYFSKVNPAPLAPTGFYITGGIGENPTLHWDPNVELDLDGYKIYQRFDQGSWSLLTTVDKYTTSFTDQGVTITGGKFDPSVCYNISAFDIAGNESEQFWRPRCVTSNQFSKEVASDNENISNFSFYLSDAFPNPFNPTTKIKYSIGKDGFVTISVLDVLGNVVTKLIEEEKSAGDYSVNFYALNLPSGIYFYRIVSGNFTATKKLIILK